LTQGLKDELDARGKEASGTAEKKRKQSEKGQDGEGKKRRKVDA
jgi:hypothetical protein